MNEKATSFYHLGLAPDMLKVLDKMKFTIPTPIQHQAIPVALEGKDIMGVAQTGTGKTMAFGIPTIQRLAAEGGQALILVPTRELAIQVKEALVPFLQPFKMKAAVLIGGVKMNMQMAQMRRNPQFIIGTPGRINDFIYQGELDLADIAVVILDEADRMLDMGFEPQVKDILRCVPHKKQTMLFSATMPSDILKLATKYMELPLTIEIAPQGTTTKDVSQELFIVKEPLKKGVLKMLLEKYHGTVLVFTRTKMKASRIARDIRDMGAKVAEIHSNRSMSQRNAAMEGFKRGRYRVLVATDIAARGIDISMIELVVNYDLPDDAENYVHRIGRTGRAGKEGHAVTLATPSQSYDVKKIEGLIKMTLPRGMHKNVTEQDFSQGGSGSKPRRGGGGGGSRGGSRGGSQGKPQGGSRGKSQSKSYGKFSGKSGDSSSSSGSSGKPKHKPKRKSGGASKGKPFHAGFKGKKTKKSGGYNRKRS